MTSTEQQIRQCCPKQTQGKELIHDERIATHQHQLYGIDVWYTLGEKGRRQYFVKRDSWPPYLNRDPEMWYAQDMWGSSCEHERRMLKQLFECGLRLDEYRPKGLAIKQALDTLRQDKRCRQAIDALLDDARYELFRQQDSALPMKMEKELDEADVCTYAWYYGHAICLAQPVDAPGNSPAVAPVQKKGEILYVDSACGYRFLSCAILARLEPTSSYVIVLSQKAYASFQNRRNLTATLRQMRSLELTNILYIELDDMQDEALVLRDPACLSTWYDPMLKCLVDVYADDGQPGGIRVVARDSMAESGGWVERGETRSYLTHVPVDKGPRGLYLLFHGLEQGDGRISILGGYVYTKGDAHDQSSDRDYYFLPGVNWEARFGITDTSDDNTWYQCTTFFKVSEISPHRPYDKLYVRICDADFEAGIIDGDAQQEWFRRHESQLLYLRLTNGDWEDAQKAVLTFEQLVNESAVS